MRSTYKTWLREVFRRRIRLEDIRFGSIITFPYEDRISGKRAFPLLFVTRVTREAFSGVDLLELGNRVAFARVVDEVREAKSLRDLTAVHHRLTKGGRKRPEKAYALRGVGDLGLVTQESLDDLREIVS